MAINYSIKPILRTDKSVKENNKYPIYWLIRLNNKQIKIPTKKEVEEISWDKKKSKVLKSVANKVQLKFSCKC